MGFFIKRLPNDDEKKYVTEANFLENLKMQTTLVKHTLEKILDLGFKKESAQEVTFFFYTDTQEKTGELASSLKKRGYSVWHGPSGHDEKTFLVTGETEKLSTDEKTMKEWINEMCQLGYAYDCEFDGWEIRIDMEEGGQASQNSD